MAVGLTKPSTACLIGNLWRGKSQEKNKVFLYFYLIGSIGSILGPIFYGIGITHQAYWVGFVFSLIALLINFALLIISARKLEADSGGKHNFTKDLLVIILIILAVYLIISRIILIDWLILPVLAFGGFFLYRMFEHTPQNDRNSLYLLSVPLLASIVFFIMLLQLFSSITIIFEKMINTHILDWQVPVTWFGSIEAIFLLFIAPFVTFFWGFLAKRKIVVNSQVKIMVAFYFFLSFSGYFAGVLAKISPENTVAGPTAFASFFLLAAIGVLIFTIFLYVLNVLLQNKAKLNPGLA